MDWLSFSVGLGVGLLFSIPLIVSAVRRETRRVRRLERQARAAERLAELGMLTGGLAHEIKNPLSTVGLNVQLLQEDLQAVSEQAPQGSALQEPVGRIKRRLESLSRQTQRLREILEDFLRFAGRVKLDRASHDVHGLIDELADFFAPQAQSCQVHLRTQLLAKPSVASVDAGLLKQAVLNLLINATQAMAEARQAGLPNGGCDELIIRTERSRSLGQDEIRIHVTDTGPGIEPDKLDKVFHPYYTSKKGGTGLGLPTTRRIIEEHGGTVAVHSELGRGTDFILTVPTDRPKHNEDS